jgi:hypothetical protein
LWNHAPLKNREWSPGIRKGVRLLALAGMALLDLLA